MSVTGFGVLALGIPGAPVPFTLHVPETDLHQLSSLVQTAVLGVPSFYNTHNITDGPNHAFRPSRGWLANAADFWVNDFDWRFHEKYWNTFPQFTINVTAPSDG